jgi:hypothetical protein
LSGLEQDDSHGVVEDGLSEDECVEFWLYFVGVKDGKNGDWVGRGERRANRHGFNEIDLEAIEGYPRPEKQDEAEDKG